MGYKLYVRDASLYRVAEIDDYSSLTIIMRYNSPGSWVLTLPTKCLAARELLKIRTGIIVVRDGITLFSGPVAGKSRVWNEEEDTLTFTGSDDSIWLSRHLAYANPNVNPSGAETNFFPFFPLRLQSAAPIQYDVRKGKAETIIREYVYYNMGQGALPERRLKGLILDENLGRGKSVKGSGRFQPLQELVSSLALSGGDLGFHIIQNGNNLEFRVYEPSKKTKTAVFSPLLGNLKGFEYSLEDSEVNYIIAGGDGVGYSRIFMETGSASISKYGRFESFIDKSDTSDTEEIQQAIDEELAEKAEKMSLSISPVDTEQLAFGRDYRLGDKVSVVITHPNELVSEEDLQYILSSGDTSNRAQSILQKLEVIQDVVREVTISITSEGESITPTIGTPGTLSKKVPKIFNEMKNLKKRISKWERR